MEQWQCWLSFRSNAHVPSPGHAASHRKRPEPAMPRRTLFQKGPYVEASRLGRGRVLVSGLRYLSRPQGPAGGRGPGSGCGGAPRRFCVPVLCFLGPIRRISRGCPMRGIATKHICTASANKGQSRRLAAPGPIATRARPRGRHQPVRHSAYGLRPRLL